MSQVYEIISPVSRTSGARFHYAVRPFSGSTDIVEVSDQGSHMQNGYVWHRRHINEARSEWKRRVKKYNWERVS